MKIEFDFSSNTVQFTAAFKLPKPAQPTLFPGLGDIRDCGPCPLTSQSRRFYGNKLRKDHAMEYVTRMYSQKVPHKGTCPTFFPVRETALLLALVFSLSLTFEDSASAHEVRGYRAFAKLSNTEKVLNENECGKYGGRAVTYREHGLVMKSGRSDKYFYNVLWFGQHPYVTYKLHKFSSISRSLSMNPYTIWLCQF